jgi:predicted nucleic-acid-binding Zn-ribbon protein
MITPQNYRCVRCGHTACEINYDYAMNSAGTHFVTMTCARCRHTEFFAARTDELPSLLRLINEETDKVVGSGQQ